MYIIFFVNQQSAIRQCAIKKNIIGVFTKSKQLYLMIVKSVSIQVKSDKVCSDIGGMDLIIWLYQHGIKKIEPIAHFTSM